MSNSKLVTYTKKSPNYTKMIDKKNTHIVIHHMAGNLTVQQCGNVFASPSRQASSNYGVNGKEIGLYVDESNRSWATSSYEIDSKAVTIEVANSKGSPGWEVSDTTLDTLIKLCVDICKRNGIKKLSYTGDKRGNLHLHQWYAATACPGAYLKSKMKNIVEQVNRKLSATTNTKTINGDGNTKALWKGKTIKATNVRSGNGISYKIVKKLPKNNSITVYQKRGNWLRIAKGQWVYYDKIKKNK